ncbi:MOSC domain-containing protein [Sphingomonas sp.]|uniref:MOSC domain-containing protein n=1 Tax=Sphingomonas sp. TaxID=28214 RepID=UPI0025F0A055|nr:MOSC domain-containing protein [Sphingomonas sp.]
MKIIAVSRQQQHRVTKDVVASIQLVAGHGVEGDAHFGEKVKHGYAVKKDPTRPNLRQVHLMPAELFDELSEKGFRVTAGVMGENVTTSAIDLLALPTGTRLHLGDQAVVELTGLRDPCVLLDRLMPGLMKAVLTRDTEGRLVRKAGVMAIVIEGGEVRADDTITVALPAGPHVALEPVD